MVVKSLTLESSVKSSAFNSDLEMGFKLCILPSPIHTMPASMKSTSYITVAKE